METTQTPDPATLPLPEKERYTYADYAQLPEGAPYELIRGELVMSPSPSTYHQRLLLHLGRAFLNFVEEHETGEVLIAPMDVYLAEDTTVQPDLLYIAKDRADIIGEQKIEGAPDLIVEIFSPSTTHRDVGVKKRLYEDYGVRGYWTVDPGTQAVEIHVNTGDGFAQHARVIESGTASSTVLEGFTVDLADLFQRPNA